MYAPHRLKTHSRDETYHNNKGAFYATESNEQINTLEAKIYTILQKNTNFVLTVQRNDDKMNSNL